MDDEAIIDELVAIRGIGRWTAEMFLIFHLMRPNVLPLDDIGLLKGISVHYFSGEPVSRAEAREVRAAGLEAQRRAQRRRLGQAARHIVGDGALEEVEYAPRHNRSGAGKKTKSEFKAK
jgi:3-methyladenine DNA glycosylase/8-oxoguanine DNA glycosylase